MEQLVSIQNNMISNKNADNHLAHKQESAQSLHGLDQNRMRLTITPAPHDKVQSLEPPVNHTQEDPFYITVERFESTWEENIAEILEESSCGDEWERMGSLSPNVYSFASAKSNSINENTDSEDNLNLPFDGERATKSFAGCQFATHFFPQNLSDNVKVSQVAPLDFGALEPLDSQFESLPLLDSNDLKEELCIGQVELELARDHVIAQLLCFDNKNHSYNNESLAPLYTPEELQELKELDRMRRAVTSQH